MRFVPFVAAVSLGGQLLFTPQGLLSQVQAMAAVDPKPLDRLDGFYRRKALGVGTFIGPEELEKRHVTRTADLLRLIPGIQVSTRASARNPVTSAHCAGVGYFVDGVRAHGYNPIDAINAEDLLAIEVYKSPAQVPAQFQEQQLCAAILLWTKGG